MQQQQLLETTIGADIEIEVFFDYESAQRQTEDSPGHEAEVEINTVYLAGSNTLEISEILSEEILKQLDVECHEQIKEQYGE